MMFDWYVNLDGLRDLVGFFWTKLTGFKAGDTEGILRGRTMDRTAIVGTDAVPVVDVDEIFGGKK